MIAVQAARSPSEREVKLAVAPSFRDLALVKRLEGVL
jgi:hypothetical protein